jgi:hypothetical protein
MRRALGIRGSDENAVRVLARVSGPDPLNVPVSLERVPGGVRLHVTGAPGTSWARHRFAITIPRIYNVSVNSAGGRLSITAVHGVIRGAVAGGMITIRRVRGRVEISPGRELCASAIPNWTASSKPAEVQSVSTALRAPSSQNRRNEARRRGAPARAL